MRSRLCCVLFSVPCELHITKCLYTSFLRCTILLGQTRSLNNIWFTDLPCRNNQILLAGYPLSYLDMFFYIIYSFIYVGFPTVVSSLAPGDEDPFCSVLNNGSAGVPLNSKILLDSYNYLNLLPPHTGAVWQVVGNDNNNLQGGATIVSTMVYSQLVTSYVGTKQQRSMSTVICCTGGLFSGLQWHK